MTVDELIDALSAFPGDLPVKIAESDRLFTFGDIERVTRFRETPFDTEMVVLR